MYMYIFIAYGLPKHYVAIVPYGTDIPYVHNIHIQNYRSNLFWDFPSLQLTNIVFSINVDFDPLLRVNSYRG